MILEFENNYILSFIFDKDLKNVYLQCNELDFSYFRFCKDKLNGIVINPKVNEHDNITISKFLFEHYKIETNPDNWKLVLNLLNMEKIWKFTIYTGVLNFETKIQKYSIDNLPLNGFPFLKWLIPLCLDSMIYKTNFNQILLT